jgi:hypothetical protein
MSMSPPSASAKTDLETVVNWPLLLTAAGLGFLLLAVPATLACIAAMKGDAVKDRSVARPALEPVHVAPIATPARPIASQVPRDEAPSPLPVYVETSRPPLRPPLIVKAPPTAPTPPPDANLQVPEREMLAFKRLDPLPEEDLLHDLAMHAKEVDLNSVKGLRDKLLTQKEEKKTTLARRDRLGRVEIKWTPVDLKSPSSILALHAEHPDLKGLPMLGESECQAREATVVERQAIATELRNILDPRLRSRSTTLYSGSRDLSDPHNELGYWLEGDGLTTVVQMMQTEMVFVRERLAERLAKARNEKALIMLARLALFDSSRNIREYATSLLKSRSPDKYRSILLEGLRYPWAPVAAHAAEALVALGDREAVFSLAGLLDEPDPCLPQRNKDNKWSVREILGVNHLRNCLLCHTPSTAATDPLRGIVPTPGERLPRVYYSSQSGIFVRADVTYLRQDFSVMQRVAKPDKWPEWQRFDYMVRTRELTADELAAHAKRLPGLEPASYPQRDAVLFALRELTGLDAGETSADWYEVLWASTP